MAYDEDSAAFIVRVWIEPREVEGAPATWRGSIEYVGSGRVKYVTELDEFVRYVGAVLKGMGVEFMKEPQPQSRSLEQKLD